MQSRSRIVACLLIAGCAAMLFGPALKAIAGCCAFFRNQAVGGISIDANGIVAEAAAVDRQKFREEMLKDLGRVPQGMQRSVPIRKVSLRGLDRALAEAYKNNMGVLPDEVRYLGGLQRIEYILVYPDHSDIVLAGPGEGWKLDEHGTVVGETTGLPVLHLDDLVVALRSAQAARTEGISCSIDPTAEGRQNLEALLSRQRTFDPAIKPAIEQALGNQTVTLTGIPEDSHFARTLVAADYRMKRIAMGLEPAPVTGLRSYLDLITSVGSNVTPRWWLACNYEPVLKSEDGLAWQLRGPGVKVLTEDEFVAEDGTVKQTGRRSAAAERFAKAMTEKYGDLSAAEPVFGELRNLMDLCVAAAVIARHDLAATAGCDLPMLLQKEGGANTQTWNAPKSVATQCNYVKKGRQYVITASGGVQIESWQANQQVDARVAEVRQRSASMTSNWWWN
jgi:hypothetical protein